MTPEEYKAAFAQFDVTPVRGSYISLPQHGDGCLACAVGIRLIAACGGIEAAQDARTGIETTYALGMRIGGGAAFARGLSDGWEDINDSPRGPQYNNGWREGAAARELLSPAWRWDD
jgi:hypothetical protein